MYGQWSNQMLARRFPIKRLSGIPIIKTISVATNGSVVTYQLCPWRYRQLPNEGLLLVRIAQTPSAGAGSAAFTVSLETHATPQTGSTGTPVIDGVGENITSNKVVTGNVLLMYFNKCDGIFQVLNSVE